MSDDNGTKPVTCVKRTDAEVEAEVQKTKAETQKTLAEARKAEAQALQAECEAKAQSLRLVDIEEKHQREHCHDFYFGRYTFEGEINAESVERCISALTCWERTKDPTDEKFRIEVVFSSPGGSMVDGLALYDYIKAMQRKGFHIDTLALGCAASMAAILLQAGEVRRMGAESYLLIHEVSFGTHGKFGEIADEMKWIEKVHERVLNIFAERSGKEKAEIRRQWERKDWWLDSSEAKEYGFVDEVV